VSEGLRSRPDGGYKRESQPGVSVVGLRAFAVIVARFTRRRTRLASPKRLHGALWSALTGQQSPAATTECAAPIWARQLRTCAMPASSKKGSVSMVKRTVNSMSLRRRTGDRPNQEKIPQIVQIS